MNTRHIIVALITAAIVAVAWQTSREKAPATELQSTQLYPGLVDRVNDVQRIKVESANMTTVLEKSGDNWVVANRDGFPATFATVKNTLLNLANTSVVEEKTSKPERYARLGVADIGEADSEARLLQIDTSDGETLAALLIGNEREGSQLNAAQYYVRKTNTPSALLVEGELDVEDDPAKWMDTDVVNIATARVRRVTIAHSDAPAIVVAKEQPSDNFFSLENIPAGFTSKSRSIVSSLGAVLLDVKFESVAAAANIEGSTPLSTAEVHTFDGLVAMLERYKYDDGDYVRFRFTYDPTAVVEPETAAADEDEGADADAATEEQPSVAEEATALNEKTSGWIYRLPDYKNRMLEKLFDDLIKPVEENPAEAVE